MKLNVFATKEVSGKKTVYSVYSVTTNYTSTVDYLDDFLDAYFVVLESRGIEVFEQSNSAALRKYATISGKVSRCYSGSSYDVNYLQ